MTKLIATPLDMRAPGSHRERLDLMRAGARFKTSQEAQDPAEAVAAYELLEKLLLPHLQTDDGTPAAKALERVSGTDFDRLVMALSGAETVPEASSAS